MKIFKGLMLGVSLLACNFFGHAQQNISEATLVYDMTILTGSNASTGATSTVYLKGNNSRTEMNSALGKEITIFNSKSDNAVILKEFSGQKLMITLGKENWKSRNRAYNDVKFELTDEIKTIGTYKTRRAIAKMPDGKSFDVYYAPDLIPANKEFDATFRNLPGLAIQYEIESGKTKFRYNLVKISYDPVQLSLFDFPTTGYRIMTFEENQNLKKGN